MVKYPQCSDKKEKVNDGGSATFATLGFIEGRPWPQVKKHLLRLWEELVGTMAIFARLHLDQRWVSLFVGNAANILNHDGVNVSVFVYSVY